MIELANKYDCTGCRACADACAQAAIVFVDNNEGFAYPIINTAQCVECGTCRTVCPIINRTHRNTDYQTLVFAAYSKNEEIRLNSTSGGLFSEMAQIYYANNGYVGGAVYNPDFSISQIIDKRNRLSELRRSKYAQSSAGGIYEEIESLLKNHEQVLFCGTPCQVAALHQYLGKEYENLVSVDFLCRGIGSPFLFKRYITDLEEKYHAKVTSVQMKDKSYGWHRFAMRVLFDSGYEYCQDRHHDDFLRGYLQTDLFLRQSCFNCPFKEIPHDADITLGDFWKIETLDKDLDQDKGTSLVIVNSHKGLKIFEQIQNKIVWREFELQDVLWANPSILKHHEQENAHIRAKFYEDAKVLPFSKLIAKYVQTENKYAGMLKKNINKIIPSQIRKLLHLSYWKTNDALFNEYYDYDIRFNASWGGKGTLSKSELNSKRMRIIRCYRKCQAAQGTVWFSYWQRQLQKINDETGVGLIDNLNIGKGLIIGHTGRIVLNSRANFSEGHLFLTHGVTVGRDIRGKRKGVPRFGKDVVIRCNSTVTGNITIGDDVLIAPNTFVNFDVPSHSVVIGNPATIHHRDNATEGHVGKIIIS